MLGLLAPTAIALAAALLLGGSARRLFSNNIRYAPLVVAAFGVELVLFNPPVNGYPQAVAWGPWIWCATRLVLLAAVALNARSSRLSLGVAWTLVGIGLALNTAV